MTQANAKGFIITKHVRNAAHWCSSSSSYPWVTESGDLDLYDSYGWKSEEPACPPWALAFADIAQDGS